MKRSVSGREKIQNVEKFMIQLFAHNEGAIYWFRVAICANCSSKFDE